ncbi:MAG: DUF4401 domain-containing protein [Saprospiraceae bacterium]|nr:DUF4401 domain-containing protein [Saprospiraceae bacterium]
MNNLNSILFVLTEVKNRNSATQYDENEIIAQVQSHVTHKSTTVFKIVSIVGGLLSVAAFLSILFISNIFNSGFSMLTLGVLLYFSSIYLGIKSSQLYLDSLSFGLYMSSIFLIAIGLKEFDLKEIQISVIISILSLTTISIVKDYILIYISILIFFISLTIIIFESEIENILQPALAILVWIIVLLMSNESKVLARRNGLSLRFGPIVSGLTTVVSMGIIFVLRLGTRTEPDTLIAFSTIVIIAAFSYLIFTELEQRFDKLDKNRLIMYTVIGGLALVPSIFCLSIPASIVILFLGFIFGHRMFFLLGILLTIYCIGQYYYNLEFTLLTKSILMFITGLLFLIIYFVVNYQRNESTS